MATPSPSASRLHAQRGRTLLATALLVALVLGAPPAMGQEEASGTGPERIVDLTFPLSGPNSYVDTFHASRSGGRIHRATDLMAEKLVHVHAAVGGTVCHIKADGDSNTSLSGYMLEICGDDGLEYSYIHLNNDTPGTDDGMGGNRWAFAPGIEDGVRVERGQWIGYVGDSGNAEHVAHLHFSIHDPDMAEEDGYVNPFRSLLDAQDRGDVPDAPDDPNGVDAEGNVSGDPSTTPPQAQDDADDAADDAGDDASDAAAEPEPQPAPAVGAGGSGERVAVQRLAGGTRIGTAVALSRAAWDGPSRAVVIVPAGSHVEALVAAPLAGFLDSPVLLSEADGLPDEVAAEVRRLAPLSAYVVGSTAQLSTAVEDDLRALGVRFTGRIEAPDRYALSAAVVEDIASYDDAPALDEVILALGDAEDASRAWPDALSAGALAAHTVTPVLLTRGDRLPDPIADVLTELRPRRVIVVGGTAAIRDSVAEEAAELAGATLTRLAGPSRFATSVAVAERAQQAGLDHGPVWVATGRNFPDALAAGPAAARMGAPLLLLDGVNPDGAPESMSWLAEETDDVVVVGGTSVVSDDVIERIAG